MAELVKKIQAQLTEIKKNREHAELRYFNLSLYPNVLIEPPFFKLEKNGVVFYLLGTYHYVPLEVFPEAILKIITQCKNIILESYGPPKANEEFFIKLGLFSKELIDIKWLNQLSSDAKEILENGLKVFCKRHKINIPMERVVPEMAYYICHGAACEEGMDESLELLFKTKILSLEEHSEAFPILPKFSSQELETSLVNDFGFLKKVQNYFEWQLDRDKKYLNGSVLFDKDIVEEEGSRPDNFERTRLWLPKLRQYFCKIGSPSLIAVGLGHLLGEKGLLYLLEEEGFQISRINRMGSAIPFSAERIYGQSQEKGRPLLILSDRLKTKPRGDVPPVIKWAHVRVHPMPGTPRALIEELCPQKSFHGRAGEDQSFAKEIRRLKAQR